MSEHTDHPAADPRRPDPQQAYARFAASFGFPLDDYQAEACQHLADGKGVLVAAPTGAGKTVVGEFAVELALDAGRKCFYTTPIKALSNQKYNDLVRRHGAENVGLLTGDTSHNGEAPVVVMTTEVLRNMIYAESATLDNLGYVVLDEVHYLADRNRGAVWEEVIIGLSDAVQLVGLSATVSNAEEFGEWLNEVRGGAAFAVPDPDQDDEDDQDDEGGDPQSGPAEPGDGGELAEPEAAVVTVVSERRPVPLFQHVMVGSKLHDLFDGEAPTARVLPDKEPPRVNPDLVNIAKQEARGQRDDARRPRGRSGKGKPGGRGAFGGAAHPRHRGKGRPQIRRDQMVETLQRAHLLPGIVFIFSRAGCDQAVGQVVASGIELTNAAERAEIDEVIDRHTGALAQADRTALGWGHFAEALRRGIAAHHAGLLPAFKACVEECFVRGLCKVVFATETLALGINMPARSVVIERLVKYNGETHADITPGEYTQLTGRAGRRGIDVEGHAVVLWQPGMDPRAVAGLAARRTYPLNSSFAPTYNMAVNLIGRLGRDRARTLLEQSFAQFQADRSVVGGARRVRRQQEAAARAWQGISCDRGDFQAYARLRAEISERESAAAQERKAKRRDRSVEAVVALTAGDIITIPAGKWSGLGVVVRPGSGKDREGPRPWVLTEHRQIKRLGMHDFPQPPHVVGKLRVPKQFDHREARDRRSLMAAFDAKLASDEIALPDIGANETGGVPTDIEALRRELREHPCHDCPDREDHARLAEPALRLERDARRTEARVGRRSNTIAQRFDRICGVLLALGYLADDSAELVVTDEGQHLARIYSELDLLTAECLRMGIWDGLSAPQLAACLSTLLYESRRADDHTRPQMPDARTDEVVRLQQQLLRQVRLLERDHKLESGKELDLGFAEVAFAWAAGRPLSTVLGMSGLTAGDFVRWIRQLIDFTGQVANATPDPALRRRCHELVDAIRRGVVAAEGSTE
ncbi:DEAD/DEAH box helicase [Parenemella sanctibonifatiensis]|nr:DEAD/DEAH box helicase [Parenemella sanctibonifatiensis]